MTFQMPEPFKPDYNRMDSILSNIKPISEQFSDVLSELQNSQSAQIYVKQIHGQIDDFEADLDQDFEVGVKLVSFGQTITFHVSAIGWIQPSLIIFEGFTDKDEPIKLIQHINQISFLLMKIKRLDSSVERRKIGFIQPE